MIVVLDTSALVSALLYPDHLHGRLLKLVLAEHRLAVSPALAAEWGSVLARPKFARLGDHKTRQRVVQLLLSHPACVAVQPTLRLRVVLDDPDDNHIVEAAVAADADLLVARDHHLLALRQVPAPPSARPIPVVVPLDALARLAGRGEAAATLDPSASGAPPSTGKPV